jgi:hypothetical protein
MLLENAPEARIGCSIHPHPVDRSLNGVNHMVRGRRHGRGKLAAEPWPRTVAVFGKNEIDESVLPDLTEDHLRELGFPLGARLKILKAIAALGKHAEATSPSAASATSPTVPGLTPEDRAERRQVTVMFSDLVGSTALSARMDPEDLREVISAYQKCVANTVQRFGGFVAKYMGDGVLRVVCDHQTVNLLNKSLVTVP